MDEMITFQKNFEDRLEEYLVLFGNKEITATEIKKQWSIYMEFILDSPGWQALWKVPRSMCEKIGIPFPTVVIVHVESINFEDLDAQVQIVAVQGNMDLPLVHTASLTKLWPTKQQAGIADILSIANTLDMYRFFYYYLWMPWDLQDSSNTDWVKNHLADRLRLYFNLKNGNIPNYKARGFRALLAKVKTLLECIDDDGTSSINIDISNDTPDEQVENLTKLHFKMNELKSEMEILRTYHEENRVVIPEEPSNWLIFNSGNTLEQYTDFLESVRYLVDKVYKFKSAVTLQDALDSANCTDSILVSSGIHKVCSAGVLDDGVIIKSTLSDRTQAIIDSSNENSFLDFSGKNLTIENLTIYVSAAQCGIMAQTGMVYIKNCIITGQKSSATQQHGIVALPGSDVHIENCYITGFCTGFSVSSFSSLSLHNCTISNVANPIKIYSSGAIEVHNSKFLNYKKHAIYFETESEETVTGDISLLESKTNAKFVDCIFDSNEKDSSPVVIVNKRLV